MNFSDMPCTTNSPIAESPTNDGPQDNNTHGLFPRVSEIESLDVKLPYAKIEGRPVMLDYYTDWCVDCIRMENATFSDPEVQLS